MKIPTLIAVAAAALSAASVSAQFDADVDGFQPPAPLSGPECVIDDSTPNLLAIALAPTPFDRLRTGMSPREVRALVGPESLASTDGSRRILAYAIANGPKGETLPHPRIMFVLFVNDALTNAKLVDAETFSSHLHAAAGHVQPGARVAASH